ERVRLAGDGQIIAGTCRQRGAVDQKQNRQRLRTRRRRAYPLAEQVELHLPLLRPIFPAPDRALGELRARRRLRFGRRYSRGKSETEAEAAGRNEIASRQLAGFHRPLREQVRALPISPVGLWPQGTLTQLRVRR